MPVGQFSFVGFVLRRPRGMLQNWYAGDVRIGGKFGAINTLRVSHGKVDSRLWYSCHGYDQLVNAQRNSITNLECVMSYSPKDAHMSLVEEDTPVNDLTSYALWPLNTCNVHHEDSKYLIQLRTASILNPEPWLRWVFGCVIPMLRGTSLFVLFGWIQNSI